MVPKAAGAGAGALSRYRNRATWACTAHAGAQRLHEALKPNPSVFGCVSRQSERLPWTGCASTRELVRFRDPKVHPSHSAATRGELDMMIEGLVSIL